MMYTDLLLQRLSMATPVPPEVAVFTDTSLGTSLVVAVPRDITAGAFKRELERAHLNCFPKMGKIQAFGVMVERRSKFYHLPDTELMYHIFHAVGGAWFLFVEVKPLCVFNSPHLPQDQTTKVGDVKPCNFADCIEPNAYSGVLSEDRVGDDIGKCKRRRKETVLHLKKKEERKRVDRILDCKADELVIEFPGLCKQNPDENASERFCIPKHKNETEGKSKCSSMVDAPACASSEVISVSGIIERYFQDCNEGSNSSYSLNQEETSRCIQIQPEADLKENVADSHTLQQPASERPLKLSSIQLPADAGAVISNKKMKKYKFGKRLMTASYIEKPKVGKRLIMASNILGISPGKQRAEISLCSNKDRSLRKCTIFDMSDSEDLNDKEVPAS